jgi:hypothetical protein
MRTAGRVLFGWLVPGGVYLLQRQYARFAVILSVVAIAFCAGIALHGGLLWPSPVELAGTDGLTILMAKAGTATKMLAGGPYLLAEIFGQSQTFIGGRVHEYGTVLLDLAGLFNLLALAGAIETESH